MLEFTSGFYWDTVKSFSYLGLGLGAAYIFWGLAEKFAQKGLRVVDPLLFLIIVVWGASGFFFLGSIEWVLRSLPFLKVIFEPIYNFFDPVLDFIYHPVPDWDIRLYIWTNGWELFRHRSWLFSSVMIPSIILASTMVIAFFYQSRSVKKVHYYLNILHNVAIGLFVGMSAHLFGDFFLRFLINRGDMVIQIYNWNQITSFSWLMGNLILGFLLPFTLIWLKSTNLKKKRERRVTL